MPGDYPVLAGIYDAINMDTFGHQTTPEIIDTIQRRGWMGRQIVDLGSGTGASLEWITRHGYVTTGMDSAPEMIAIATANFAAMGLSCRHLLQDIRQIDHQGQFDLALAINTLNELSSITELENTFRSVHHILKKGQWLVFDLFTIRGLMTSCSEQTVLQHENSDELAVFSSSCFDHERQLCRRDFTIFQKTDDNWQRQTAMLVLRAFPVQGVGSLLKRCGFSIVDIMTLDFKPYRPDSSSADRVIFIAQKE